MIKPPKNLELEAGNTPTMISQRSLKVSRAVAEGHATHVDPLTTTLTKATLMCKYKITIDGMHCESCVEKIESAMNALPSVSSCTVSLADQSAVIAFGTEAPDLATTVEAIQQQGFTVTGYTAVE